MTPWLLAFTLTLLSETPVVLAFLSASEPVRWRLAFLVLYANLATHPLVWFAFPQVLQLPGRWWLGPAEAYAVLAEAAFYQALLRPGWRRAAAASLCANGASFVLGLALHAMVGWP